MMCSECCVKRLVLSVSNIYIRVCVNSVEVDISPSWDSIDRHKYVAVGVVDEVIKELKQLAEDILKSIKALEDMVREVMSGN